MDSDPSAGGTTVTNLTPLELATNGVFGLDPTVPPLPVVPADLTPLAALEAAVLPAVARPPCVVTFSGGRDSSLVLAIAAKVAKREGLPAPVPATIRFIGIEGAEETSWQELVLGPLELDERVSISVRTGLDFVGPIAGRVLRRHGVLWPLNIYLHESLIGHAKGGSLMTGMTGDAVFGGGRWLGPTQWLADDADTTLVQPLADRTVLASMANAGGSLGIGDRTAIMRSLFTEVLPDQLLARPDKAV